MQKDGPVGNAARRVREFLSRDVWRVELTQIPTFKGIGIRAARIFYLAVRGLVKNECLHQASALTYITVLSIVPCLALGFSVAKGFGAYDHLVENTIRPFLDSTFGPPGGEPSQAAGQELRDAVERILDFVSRTNFSNLGIFGLAFVLFTAIKLLTSVENVFNRIWGVERSRSFVRKVTDYVALLVVTPILLVTSTALTGALQSNAFVTFLTDEWHLGGVLALLFRLLPLVSLWIGFAFLYVAMPNTRVKVSSALVGGVLGGTLWQILQVLHVEFQVGVARYNAIYAGFAAFPIFLVWIYSSWVTVLLGAQLAWAHQAEPEYRDLMRETPRSIADQESLAVHALAEIVHAFVTGRGVVSTSSLAARFGVAPRAVAQVLSSLAERRVVAHVEAESGWVPARDPDTTRISDVLDAVRGTDLWEPDPDDPVDCALLALREEGRASPENVTLRELGERWGAWRPETSAERKARETHGAAAGARPEQAAASGKG